MNSFIFALLHLAAIALLLWLSYIVSHKRKNKWKAWPVLPLFVVVIVVSYFFISFDKLVMLLDQKDTMTNFEQILNDIKSFLSFDENTILKQLGGLLFFLLVFASFIILKVLYRIVSKLINIYPFWVDKDENTNKFVLKDRYIVFSYIFTALFLTFIITTFVFSFFHAHHLLTYEIYVLDMLCILFFELCLNFDFRLIPKMPLYMFKLRRHKNISNDILKNNPDFEKFYNMIEQNKNLKDNLQLAILDKIRVVKKDNE